MIQTAGVMARRLRARQVEIEWAIFAHVSDRWLDRADGSDPDCGAGLRAASDAALDYILAGIERSGASLQPVPAAVSAQARRAARGGIGLETMLRCYLAGHALVEGFVIYEAERGALVGEGRALRDVLQIVSALIDRLLAAVSIAYSDEIEQAGDAIVASEDTQASYRTDTSSDCARSGVCGRISQSRAEAVTMRRARILQAMVEVAAERGFANTSVKLVTTRARVSTSTFYAEFKSLQDCFGAVLDMALEHASRLIVPAFAREERWQDGVLGALASLLVFFDSQPLLTLVWFVEAMSAGSWALHRRERIAERLRLMIIAHWTARGMEPPEPVAATGVMASVLGVIQAHLVNNEAGPLIGLLSPLMGLVTQPYLDKGEVAREVQRAARLASCIRAGDTRWRPPASSAALDTEWNATLPARLTNPNARRMRECLMYIAEKSAQGSHPSNREIGRAIGVNHKSQISRLLSCLSEGGLAVKRSEGAGAPNAWRLTDRGRETVRVLAEQES